MANTRVLAKPGRELNNRIHGCLILKSVLVAMSSEFPSWLSTLTSASGFDGDGPFSSRASADGIGASSVDG